MKQNRFDEAAKTWDQDEKRRAMASAIATSMKTRIGFSKRDIVMDLGAGTGLITFEIAPFIQKLYAVDTSQGMLAALTQKVKSQGLMQVYPSDWDVLSSDSFPESVNVIVSAMAFHHIKDCQQAIKNLYRVLSPQGQIAIADLVTESGDFHQDHDGVHHFGFSREQLIEWFSTAGFQAIQVDEVYTIERPQPDGGTKVFPVFLITARK